MKPNEDKNLEKFIDKLMSSADLETPSVDFTAKVMQQVLMTKTSKTIVYKPLISRTVWFVIFASIVSICIFSVVNNDTPAVSWFDSIMNYKMNFPIPTFAFSKISMYAILLAVLLLFVQISFLKNHFDKQFEK